MFPLFLFLFFFVFAIFPLFICFLISFFLRPSFYLPLYSPPLTFLYAFWSPFRLPEFRATVLVLISFLYLLLAPLTLYPFPSLLSHLTCLPALLICLKNFITPFLPHLSCPLSHLHQLSVPSSSPYLSFSLRLISVTCLLSYVSPPYNTSYIRAFFF